MTQDMEVGSCCICEGINNVRNVIQLNYKVKSETCWGCFQCGLPIEGAVAVVCDGCVTEHADGDIEPHIRFLMDSAERRIPVVPIPQQIPHEHDMKFH